MFGEALGFLGVFFVLQNIEARHYPKYGGKVRSRTLFEDDPKLAKCFGHSIIRPTTIPKPPYNLPLYGSFKGPCFRQTAIVKPAVIPRPIYVQPDCKPNIGCNNEDIAAAAAAAAQMITEISTSNCLNPAPVLSPDYQAIDVSKAYQQALAYSKSSVPADAVSLALAYKMYLDSLNKKVCEDGLTYGFRKLPLENTVPVRQPPPTVSEGNLYSLCGQIVELKPLPEEAPGDLLSAEAMDELVDLTCDTEISGLNFAPKPSLADLGYTPTKLTKPTFIDISPLPAPCASELLSAAPESPATPQCSEDSVAPSPSQCSKDPVAPFPPQCSEDPVPPKCPGEPGLPVPTEPPECPESEPPMLPPPLTIEGSKPGDVVYKEKPSVDCDCESQEEVVTYIPVPVPPCGCQFEDVLEGIRTYDVQKIC